MAVTRERYVWRTDLTASAPYWKGWYLGMSELFLSVKAPKILMLAGSDRLDKTLTIGQMQGKFQMSLLPQVISSTIVLEGAVRKVICCMLQIADANHDRCLHES